MILVDSSVWIDHLRDVRSRAAVELERLMMRHPTTIATTEPVEMELLSGARVADLMEVQLLISTLVVLSVAPSHDYVDGAVIFRAARSIGRPVRSTQDCLIAAVALRHDVELWHKDGDFESIAAATQLRTVDLR